jgi:glycosyltransferase involved in cell wall biosynthesis
VLSDPKTAQKIGKAGRTYVEKEHSWKRIGQKLENIYYETIESNSK